MPDDGTISYDEIRAHASGPVAHVLQFFDHKHLSPELAAISKPFGDLAHTLAASNLHGPELTVGLRKLLEAKDCIVRAVLSQ
jgi:hypothetical protein